VAQKLLSTTQAFFVILLFVFLILSFAVATIIVAYARLINDVYVNPTLFSVLKLSSANLILSW
jgi:hypothetical protein